MLGHKLVQKLSKKFDVWTTLRANLSKFENFNIFDRQKTIENIKAEDFFELRNIVSKVKPDVIINAVGLIKQLPSSKNVIETLTVNSILPHKLAEIAAEFGARLINVSTDCVFSGVKGNYTEDDVSDAYDLYGKSKNLGEVSAENCLTFRTSIIGRELTSAHSLVEWFLSNRGKKVKGFVNAIYSGFPTTVFAAIITDLILEHPKLYGLYHVSSEPINKYELLKLINDKYQAGIEIEPETDFKIDRSLNSAKYRKVTGFSPPTWEEMIEQMACDPTPYDEWKK